MQNLKHLFPDFQDPLEKDEEVWDTSLAFPVPRNPIPCPSCGRTNPLAREFVLHQRGPEHTHNCRCDVLFKCTDCAMVWIHGVVVTPERYQKTLTYLPQRPRNAPKTGGRIKWREAKKILEQELAEQE